MKFYEIIHNTMKITDILLNLIKFKEEEKYSFVLSSDNSDETNSEDLKPLEDTNQEVYSSIDINLQYVKEKYHTDINSDIKTREFFVNARGKQYKAFLLFIDGMINSESINRFVVEPLMLKNTSNTTTADSDIVSTAVTGNVTVRRVKKFNLSDYISERLVPQNDVSTETTFKEVFGKVNAGLSALFVDTINTVFLVDAKGFEKRSISPPDNEMIIRGSQESFIESIRTNTSLLRRLINNENLVIEDASVGTISETKIRYMLFKRCCKQKIS